MLRETTVRWKLRAATADAHERVDRVFSAFDLSTREGYGAFLQAQAQALLPLERALDAGAGPALALDWPDRRRGTALLADLANLGLDVPSGETVAPIGDEAEALGTLYVLEGSRLGGILLKRSLPEGFPAAFLAEAPSHRWQALLAGLEAALPTAALLARAITAAEQAFRRFELSGQSFALRIA